MSTFARGFVPRGDRSPAAPAFERHRGGRAGWLRAAVLGADDGIVSTASLMLGVAASSASHGAILTAGLAALATGAMAMAVGEFVSVSSQRDVERADLRTERIELSSAPAAELDELTAIYRSRGLDRELARRVAEQLTANDALGAHARDELGLHAASRARPLQAAWVSAMSFALGALVPLLAFVAAPAAAWLIPVSALVAWVRSARSRPRSVARPAARPPRGCSWAADWRWP